jgi:hypothetical protein
LQWAQLFFASFIECINDFTQNCYVAIVDNYFDYLHGFIIIDLYFEDYWLLFFDSYFLGFIDDEHDFHE